MDDNYVPKPDKTWDQFCNRIINQPGYTVEYAYMGTIMERVGQDGNHPGFAELTESEAYAISNSNGVDFQFRGDEYSFVQYKNGVYDYDGPSRELAYGHTFKCILIVFSFENRPKGRFLNQCQHALRYGLSHLCNMRV
ncbi:uncharacterized protein LOC143452578 [Clavelina lepadiformis]|uniref:Profilin n=1 Tax=Clavelina lepadiformis TaxID=159417 RepID=A0ABP0GM32_CLALP